LLTVVEEIQARTSIYPPVGLVQQEWQVRRTDYMASPWGGALQNTTAGVDGGNVTTDQEYGDTKQSTGLATVPLPATQTDAGRMIYLRGSDSRFFWVRDTANSPNVRVRGFAVGMVSSRGESWMGATGNGRTSVAGTGKGDISGGVSN
jgi:hypothetical protein